MTYEEAQTRCINDAPFLHLPVPQSEAENCFFSELTSEQRIWIGLNRNSDDQNWSVDCSNWSRADACGADFFGYQNWFEQSLLAKGYK